MPAKNQLLVQFDLHYTLFNNVLVDINEEESDIRLAPGINNIKWLAGHLVWGQGALARMGSVPMNIEWLAHYDTQIANPPGPELRAPSLEEIKAGWNKLNDPIRKGLEALPDEVLNTPLNSLCRPSGLWKVCGHLSTTTRLILSARSVSCGGY